ncbi:MAG: hypothetical protein V1820_02250 [archaeon]
MAGFEGTSISSKVKKVKAADGPGAYTEIILKPLLPGAGYSREDQVYDALGVLKHVAAYPDLPVKIRTEGEGDFSQAMDSLRNISVRFARKKMSSQIAFDVAEDASLFSDVILGEKHPLTLKLNGIWQDAASDSKLGAAAKKILGAYETAEL